MLSWLTVPSIVLRENEKRLYLLFTFLFFGKVRLEDSDDMVMIIRYVLVCSCRNIVYLHQ